MVLHACRWKGDEAAIPAGNYSCLDASTWLQRNPRPKEVNETSSTERGMRPKLELGVRNLTRRAQPNSRSAVPRRKFPTRDRSSGRPAGQHTTKSSKEWEIAWIMAREVDCGKVYYHVRAHMRVVSCTRVSV